MAPRPVHSMRPFQAGPDDALKSSGEPAPTTALFEGTERFFRPNYAANLCRFWIPALDGVEENLNPVGRVFYAASTMICTPASRAQEVGMCLGAQAGEEKIGDVVPAGGFSRFRRAAETPFNMVYEARP